MKTNDKRSVLKTSTGRIIWTNKNLFMTWDVLSLDKITWDSARGKWPGVERLTK